MESRLETDAVSPPLPAKAPKSPPLAFEKTSNDSLAPLNSTSPRAYLNFDPSQKLSLAQSEMGRLSPPAASHELELQIIVDQQANAIQMLHDAFAAERQVWYLERERLDQRIANLEKLLRSGDHYSPAKSPVMSPLSGSSSLTSPSNRVSISAPRLPSIPEDVNIQPLSKRREGAPHSIDLSVPAITMKSSERFKSISFTNDNDSLEVEEIAVSSPGSAKGLSPPPRNNRMAAGHTPLKAPRPPTPPPADVGMDGIEDTPTRHNTHINNFLTKTIDEDEDQALNGPLNMPELPNKPDETNFTLEALSKRLEQIEQHPEEAKPMVFAEPSPGLASPADPGTETSQPTVERVTVGAIEPTSTRNGEVSLSDISPGGLSPSAKSPNGALLSQDQSREMQVHHDFEQGGIKLKKKPSTNFGAPFGQLGGYGNLRKMS